MTVLQGQVALVSGGGSGIGRATVAALMSAGARVAFTDIAPSQIDGALFVKAYATCAVSYTHLTLPTIYSV